MDHLQAKILPIVDIVIQVLSMGEILLKKGIGKNEKKNIRYWWF